MTLFIYASSVLMVDFVGHNEETQSDAIVQARLPVFPSHLHPISINLPNSPGSLGSHPGLHDHPLHHDHIERLVGASAARGRLSIAGDRDAGLHHPLLGHLQPRYEGLPMDFGGIWGSLMELFRFLRSDPFPDASEMPISRCLERLKFDVSRSIYCPFFLGPHFISFCDL